MRQLRHVNPEALITNTCVGQHPRYMRTAAERAGTCTEEGDWESNSQYYNVW